MWLLYSHPFLYLLECMERSYNCLSVFVYYVFRLDYLWV